MDLYNMSKTTQGDKSKINKKYYNRGGDKTRVDISQPELGALGIFLFFQW